MQIALVAHDRKKQELLDFVREHRDFFSRHELVATGTTGQLIAEEANLTVERVLSGPYGGDQQIGARISLGQVNLLLFFRDPLTPQPHEPDISALLRICDVHDVPAATNGVTAKHVIYSLRCRMGAGD